jgi:hypothetical protein
MDTLVQDVVEMRTCLGDGDKHVNNLWTEKYNIRQEVRLISISFVSIDNVM